MPTHDLFSFSRPGAPWFAWEWMTDVIYALLFQAAGLKGIVLMSGVLIAAYATIVLRYTLWRGANVLVAAATTLLAVGGSSMHFLARPHLFTLLFLPICIWVLEVDRRKHTPWLWALIPLTALWTNLHGGFVIFIACIGLLVAGCSIEQALGTDRKREIRRYAALLAGCSLASVVNPYGVLLHVHIWEYLRADWIRNLIQEFQAPTFRNEAQTQLEIVLIAGLITSGFLLARRRYTEALWVVFLAHACLTSLRHAPLFVAVAAPLVAVELSEWWGKAVEKAKKSDASYILHQLGTDLKGAFQGISVWPAVLIVTLAALDAPLQWPHDFPSILFPTSMVHQHADVVASGRLLTPDQWGDYVIYTFYPRQKVYVDGRSDFLGEKLGREYVHLMQGDYDWREIMARNRFDVALLPVDWPLASMLKMDPAWRLVADDGKAILFRRVSTQTLRN
ncbi:MAG TPA: hypothetical protein VFW44_11275 [Bryobacteraceae bacterium]|nr:hypothetical protein [Bryobacteraceae bacterium]